MLVADSCGPCAIGYELFEEARKDDWRCGASKLGARRDLRA